MVQYNGMHYTCYDEPDNFVESPMQDKAKEMDQAKSYPTSTSSCLP